MRNLLINLIFIFIFILGGALNVAAQRTEEDTKGNLAGGGIIDILNFNSASFAGGGIIDILQIMGGGRISGNTPKVKVSISTLDGISIINHAEDYTYTDMQITLPSTEVDALSKGMYLLSVTLDDTLIGKEEIQIE